MTIADLEHELGIAGHEDDCRVCQTRRSIDLGQCHGDAGGGFVWRMFGCPHDD